MSAKGNLRFVPLGCFPRCRTYKLHVLIFVWGQHRLHMNGASRHARTSLRQSPGDWKGLLTVRLETDFRHQLTHSARISKPGSFALYIIEKPAGCQPIDITDHALSRFRSNHNPHHLNRYLNYLCLTSELIASHQPIFHGHHECCFLLCRS